MRTLIAVFFLTFYVSMGAQNQPEALPEKKPDSIQLILKKNQKIQKIYLVDQIDYIINSNNYNMKKTDSLHTNFSASLVNQIDAPFSEWVNGDPTQWSGSIYVYKDGEKKPAITVDFEQSKINSFSQSISQTKSLENTIFFTSELKGIRINGIKID